MFDSQAHRGGRDARPENTLYSYLYGMEIGANIECDMQLARDGIVMSHNPVLNPDITRDIHGSYLRTGIYDIRLMTIEEIKSFDVGAINPESEYFGLHGSQTALHAKIPTLEEMFQLAVDTGHNTTEFNIETKSYPDPQSPFYENNADPHKFVDEFLRIVRKYKMEKRVILQSFDWRTLRIMKDESPEIRTSALYQLSPDSPVDGDTIHMTRREGDADKKLDQLTEVSGGQFMYSHEERLKAVKLHVDSGMGLKGIMRTLGYPHDIKVLRQWCREFKFSREIHEVDGFDDGYSLKQKTLAVKYFVNCGDLRRTIREIGYPSSTQRLKIWVEKYNLNENDHWQADQNPVKWGQDRQTGSSPLIQENPFEEIEIASNAIYKDLGFLEELFQRRLATMSKKDSEVTIESLKEEMQVLLRNMENLRKENKALLKANQSLGEKTKSLDEKCQTLAKEYKELGEQTLIKRIEYEALEIAAETIKKEEGISLKTLTNREKAIVIDALLSRSKYPLKKLLTVLNMAKASYFYQKSAMKAGDKYAEIRETIKDKFKKNRSVYGYRRIWLALRKDGKILSEKLVRRFMKEDHLVPYRKKAKKYSSYKGEISPAPNLVNRNFHADELGKLLLTDITEFHISAGKVYLSAITDVFDGKIVAWTIGTSPNAKLVNTMLVKAREALGDDKHPIVHSDRGIHYQWPGWIALMKKFGWTRSMSKKGCSPDNAACEGVFGRVKNEMFYNRSWIGVSIKEFIAYLDDYLHWYNEDRIKITLGGMSPVEYRESLGIM